MRNPLVERWNFLTIEQKVSVGILSVCGVLALGLAFYRVQHSVSEPFLVDKAKALAFTQSLTPTDEELAARQKRTDTDGDGISDWDEVNVYHTNPNLKDTCGDGIPDNIRILTGRNLNCAEKGAKTQEALDLSLVAATTSQLYGNFPQTPSANAMYGNMLQAAATNGLPVTAGTSTASDGTFLPRDPAAIRAALKGKVDSTALDGVSDAQLLQYYDQALAAQQTATSTP